MNYRSLAGIQVSEIGFGGWGIGGRDWGPTDDLMSIKALRAAYEAGITFYDTAPTYGRSEALIGDFFRPRRDKVVICTKTVDGDIEESLRHFGYIDVLLLHGVPMTQALLTIMLRLVNEGKIRRYGISPKNPADALLGTQLVEINFSMMDQRAIECGVFARGFDVIARTPLNFGFLSGTITKDTVFPEGHHLNKWPREQIEAWINHAAICRDGRPPGRQSVQHALNWVLKHPVSTCIVGMMTPEQVAENV